MYENDGPDLGYTLNTHHENLQMAYHYWRGTPLGDILLEEENRFGKWLSYNLLPEPGQPFWVANRSIETRQQHAIFPAVDTPLADRCVIMRAFATPPERRAAADQGRARKTGQRLAAGRSACLSASLSALSPYRFLQRAHYDWHPTAEQMAEARKLLRPLNEKSFVEQMKDTREPIVFTYVRRPGYYAAFASAPKVISEQQRLGLTFVWTPEKGVLLQSQTNGTETAWGTTAERRRCRLKRPGSTPTYSNGNTVVRYPLPGGGQKTVTFADDRIRVSVEREGEIVERVPVFDPACVVSTAQIKAGPAPARRSGQAPAPCANPEAGCPASEGPVPGKTLSVVELHATGKLEYEIRPVA